MELRQKTIQLCKLQILNTVPTIFTFDSTNKLRANNIYVIYKNLANRIPKVEQLAWLDTSTHFLERKQTADGVVEGETD